MTDVQAMSAPIAVTLDAGPAVHQRAGLSRYTEQLASTLWRECADDIALQLFYNRHSGHNLPPSLSEIPVKSISAGQYAWRLSVLASQIGHLPYFPLQAKLGRSRLYHATEHLVPRLNLPTVMTVHDLIFERFPQHHKATNRAFLRVGMPLFVRAATHLIAVSRHTAQDLASLYQVPTSKVTVIHEGVESDFQLPTSMEIDDIRTRYSPNRPYFLMLGTLEPRKNHLLALTALAKLKNLGYPHRLVIAGGKGWLFEPVSKAVVELGLANDVSFTGYVPAQDLPGLYGAAQLFLLPSQYEGFGLPLLEAMACGAPVICSRASSLPELAGDAALYIDTTDADGLVAAIRKIVDHPELALTLRDAGIRQAQNFTWQATAKQTAALYRQIAAM